MMKYVLTFAFAVLAFLVPDMAITTANAQTTRSTAVSAGQTIDINVWGDCKRVSFNGWGGNAGVYAPWDTAAEWQNLQ